MTHGDSGGVSERWRTALADAFAGLQAERLPPGQQVPPGPLAGAIEHASLGRVDAFRVGGTPQVVRRTRRSLADVPDEPFKVCLQRRGRSVVRQGGTELVLRPGDIAIYDTSRPYELRFDEAWECLAMTLPRRALAAPGPAVERSMAHGWTSTDGRTGVLGHLLGSAVRQVPQAGGATHLGEAAIQLLSSLVGGEDLVDPGEALRARVIAHLEAHASDPELSHDAVAAAHGLSPRSLHRLFEGQPLSAMAHLREFRLLAIRDALVDPAHASRSTATIASRWGFPDPSHFARTFRSRFGVTPGALRKGSLTSV
ncbi:helix-turn-helix domain-containing protein [Nocardioides sp. NPDC057767]|uniref:AraC-like ligand-binding domain-containing protein n=1 Tax=unclassified Nocardioides TaxID=2615069 RepID=UPI00366BB4C4